MDAAPVPLLLNPNARGSHTMLLRRWLSRRPGEFAIGEHASLEEARSWVRSHADCGAPVVVAAGGDGTLNIVASELAGTQTALGVLPSGSVNVFAREIGLPFRNFEACYQIIRAGKMQEIDVFCANSLPFLQMAGVGFDACVVERTTWEKKKKWGPLAYVFSALSVLREKPETVILTEPDGSEHAGVFVVMGNGRLYGGSFPLFPLAEMADGLLDVLVFKKLGLSLAGQFARAVFFWKKLPGSPHIEYLRLPACQVKTSAGLPFELDGDVRGNGPVAVSLSDKKLKVIVP